MNTDIDKHHILYVTLVFQMTFENNKLNSIGNISR